MRILVEPLSSQQLQRVIDATVREAMIVQVHNPERRPPITRCDGFKDDFLNVRLPTYIRVVCK
jgi:hypothetical protein